MLLAILTVSGFLPSALAASDAGSSRLVYLLKASAYAHHVEYFNQMAPETVTNLISNRESWSWLSDNIPLFECPENEIEQTYYFRWWSFRKHLKQTPDGFVLTEFLTPVSHAGAHNTISCAAGHHLAEGRWLREQRYLDDYTRFWLRGAQGKPQPHFHKFSSWFAAAVYDRYLVNQDRRFVTSLLEDLVADYRLWETERQTTNGLFWQFDVRDGMEESISGSRRERHLRPTINSYMIANGLAIAAIAGLAGKPELSQEFQRKAESLRRLLVSELWDPSAKFFKVRRQDGTWSDAREAIGFIPWYFELPPPTSEFTQAFAQLTDPDGFHAPFGLTTAERRHPRFRSHGIGTCEWDGAVWPFATSQTLRAMGNILRSTNQGVLKRNDYFDAFLTYVRSQRARGTPYIGEYLDEVTGDWIDGKNGRSAYYNHSTFADLLITGLIGLIPQENDAVLVYPLLPTDLWEWFALDNVSYHGRMLSIFWDRTGTRYSRGKGFVILANGQEIARAERLSPLSGKLP
jgi:hypothetical protein